jgi:acyl carrier protein
MNNFIEKFTALLEDTDFNTVDGDTVFKDLDEWDSLLALSLITMIDEEYKVKITGDDIRNSSSINDLYAVINIKKNA